MTRTHPGRANHPLARRTTHNLTPPNHLVLGRGRRKVGPSGTSRARAGTATAAPTPPITNGPARHGATTPTSGSGSTVACTKRLLQTPLKPQADGGTGHALGPPVMDSLAGSPGSEPSGQIGRLGDAPRGSRRKPSSNRRRARLLQSTHVRDGWEEGVRADCSERAPLVHPSWTRADYSDHAPSVHPSLTL